MCFLTLGDNNKSQFYKNNENKSRESKRGLKINRLWKKKSRKWFIFILFFCNLIHILLLSISLKLNCGLFSLHHDHQFEVWMDIFRTSFKYFFSELNATIFRKWVYRYTVSFCRVKFSSAMYSNDVINSSFNNKVHILFCTNTSIPF